MGLGVGPTVMRAWKVARWQRRTRPKMQQQWARTKSDSEGFRANPRTFCPGKVIIRGRGVQATKVFGIQEEKWRG